MKSSISSLYVIVYICASFSLFLCRYVIIVSQQQSKKGAERAENYFLTIFQKHTQQSSEEDEGYSVISATKTDTK